MDFPKFLACVFVLVWGPPKQILRQGFGADGVFECDPRKNSEGVRIQRGQREK